MNKTKPTPFSFEEKTRLEEMIKEGLNRRECAYHLNRTFASVKREISRGGGALNYSAEESDRRLKEGREKQASSLYEPFTEKEKATIEELKKEGRSLNSIALLVGCGRRRLKRYLDEIPLPPQRSKGVLDYTRSMKERLYAIEQQIEIVFEKLEKIEGKI